MTKPRNRDQETWAKAQIKGIISTKWAFKLSDRNTVTPRVTVYYETRERGTKSTYIPITFWGDAAQEIVDNYGDGDTVVVDAELRMTKRGEDWVPVLYGKSIKKAKVSSEPPADGSDGIPF